MTAKVIHTAITLIVTLIGTVAVWHFYKLPWQILGNPADGALTIRVDALRKRDYASAYKTRLNWVLTKFDRLLGELPQFDHRLGLIDQLRVASTARSFEACLALASVYPIGFVYLSELVSAKTTPVPLVSYDGDLPLGYRAFVFFLAVLLIAVLVLFFNHIKKIAQISVASLAVCLIFVSIAYQTGPLIIPVGLSGWIAMLSTALIGFLLALVRSFDWFVKIFACGASYIACGASYAIAELGLVPPQIVGVLAGMLVVSMCYILHRIRVRAIHQSHPLLFYVGYYSIASIYISSVAWIVFTYSNPDHNYNVYSIVFLIGILPLVNAPMDWLSFAISRGLLRCIAAGSHGPKTCIFYTLVDVIVAMALLVLVGFTTICGLYLFELVANATPNGSVVNTTKILESFRYGTWQENLWVWMLLGSTLLPTTIHFLTASLAFFLQFTRERAYWAADEIQTSIDRVAYYRTKDAEQDAQAVGVNTDARKLAFVFLYLAPIPIFILWGAITLTGGFLLFSYLPEVVFKLMS